MHDERDRVVHSAFQWVFGPCAENFASQHAGKTHKWVLEFF